LFLFQEEVPVVKQANGAGSTAGVLNTQYYTHMGKLVPASTMNMLQYHSVLVERSTLPSGRTVSKVIQVRK